MARISNIVRTFVYSRILDQASGFNYWLSQIALDINYGGQPAFTLQTTAPKNIFLGAFTSATLSNTDYEPNGSYCCVYSQRDQNSTNNMVTPSEFSGAVVTVADFYLGYPTEKAPPDGEVLGDMVEDAMYETFNNQANAHLVPPGMLYNNELELVRGPMVFSGRNWQQLNRYQIVHRLYTMGRS